MALFDGFGRLNVGGGQALLKMEHEETAELATHDGYDKPSLLKPTIQILIFRPVLQSTVVLVAALCYES